MTDRTTIIVGIFNITQKIPHTGVYLKVDVGMTLTKHRAGGMKELFND